MILQNKTDDLELDSSLANDIQLTCNCVLIFGYENKIHSIVETDGGLLFGKKVCVCVCVCVGGGGGGGGGGAQPP